MRLFPVRTAFYSLILFLAAACATPTSPTGGPPDKEGPHILATEPETGTTNFNKRAVTFHFSEFINRSSVTDAISVEPDVGIPYDLDWGRKSLTIKFEENLPDFTTLIVTLGTDVKDMNGNKLATPYQVAVSTGPEIDEGKIRGRVLDARTGKGNEGNTILLYREPVDLTARADYSAETDTGGTFRFAYLRQGNYKAFWVEDRNRNRIWDRERERAQPFPREIISLQKGAEDTLQTLFVAQSDTSKPTLQGVGLFSDQRLRFRFSEDVELSDSTEIVVNDSVGNVHSDAYPLYVSPAERYVLFAHSEKPLAPGNTYEVIVRNIKDSFGNIQPLATRETTGSAQNDTTNQRIISHSGELGLYPDEPLEVVYAKPVTEQEVRDSLRIVAGSKMVEDPSKFISFERNKLFVKPPGQWKSGPEYEVRVWDPSQNRTKNITPSIWFQPDLGDLYIQLEDTTSATTYRLLLKTEERGVVADTSFSKQIEITGLPPLVYQAVVYEDRNGNRRWDHGQVEPYRAPEPYFIQNDVPVRGNFTSDLTISLNNRQ